MSEVYCVDCGAFIPRAGVAVTQRCPVCDGDLAADAARAIPVGTNVIVRSESGEVVGHDGAAVVVWLHNRGRLARVPADVLTRSLHQPGIDEQLPEVDCLAFGVSQSESDLFSSWVVNRMGLVFCPNGLAGSGVFVATRRGRICLLTAAHVVESYPAESITVASCWAEPDQEGRRPSASSTIDAIQRSSVTDAALLCMPAGFEGNDVLAFDDWSGRAALPSQDDALISAGAPSDYIRGLDVHSRVLACLKIELLWSRLVGANLDETELQIRTSRLLTGVTSFAGMSGGPVFSLADRRLLGINISEQGGFVEGVINVSARAAWNDLARWAGAGS